MKISSLAEVQAFLAVAECNSFGQAARELGIAQSTVSRRITNLELRLGHQLVLRTTRKVALTDAGVSYETDLRAVIARLESADARLHNGAVSAEGVLRVTMPTAFGRERVLPKIRQLSSRYPKLRFELDLSDRYVDVLDGEFDVAIRLSCSVQSGIYYDKIHEFELALCASPGYLASSGMPVDFSQLSDHTWLAQRVYAPVVNFPVTWRGAKTNLQISPQISVSDSTSLKTLVLADNGLAVLPAYLICEELHTGALVKVLPELEFATYEVFAAYLGHRKHTAKVKILMDALRD